MTNSKVRNFRFSILVDIVQENKSKLFGSLSSSLSDDDKNHVWENISKEISEAHGTFWSKEDVSKKWSNVLAKHK